MFTFLKKIKFKKLEMSGQICLDDPFYTAILSGIIWTVLENIKILMLNNLQFIKNNKPNLVFTPCFNKPGSVIVNINCILYIKFGHIITAVLKVLLNLRR